MLPSTQQYFSITFRSLLRHVSIIHDHHQAGIRIVTETPIQILIGAVRRIEY
jgi:hypothetical protein